MITFAEIVIDITSSLEKERLKVSEAQTEFDWDCVDPHLESIEWIVKNASSEFVGKIIYGKKHRYSERKFWFNNHGSKEDDYDFDLVECVKIQRQANDEFALSKEDEDKYFWNWSETISMSVSTLINQYREYSAV